MDIYRVPLPAEYFSAFSPCLYCCVWGGLSVFWQFVVPLYCQGFLVREACVSVLVGGAGFLLSGVQ